MFELAARIMDKHSGVFKETSPILDPRTLTSNIVNRHGKYFTSSSNNTQIQKFAKIFEINSILITFIQP